MEHGEEDGALDVELVAASLEELLDDVPAAGLLPEPLEDEGGADAPGGDGGELPLGVRREQQDRLGEACARGEQSVELAGLLELIESPESGDDPLLGRVRPPSGSRRSGGKRQVVPGSSAAVSHRSERAGLLLLDLATSLC